MCCKSRACIFVSLVCECATIEDKTWRDEMAESMCVSVLPERAWGFAVRRNCKGGKSCKQICESLQNIDNQAKK